MIITFKLLERFTRLATDETKRGGSSYICTPVSFACLSFGEKCNMGKRIVEQFEAFQIYCAPPREIQTKPIETCLMSDNDDDHSLVKSPLYETFYLPVLHVFILTLYMKDYTNNVIMLWNNCDWFQLKTCPVNSSFLYRLLCDGGL